MQKIKLLMLMLSIAVLGCRSVRYTDQMLSDMHEAKVLVSQIHYGMKRSDVEALLHPLPSLDNELSISGITRAHYLLKSGIMVDVDYGPYNTTGMPPTSLEVKLDRINKYGDYRTVPLSQIE